MNYTSKSKDESKHVSFHTLVRVQWTLGRHNYTSHEFKASFFSSRDLDSIRRSIRKDLVKVVTGAPPANFELQGLECYFPQESATKRFRRILAWDEVFSEQSRQYKSKSQDSYHLSKGYSAVSREALKDAHERAIQLWESLQLLESIMVDNSVTQWQPRRSMSNSVHLIQQHGRIKARSRCIEPSGLSRLY